MLHSLRPMSDEQYQQWLEDTYPVTDEVLEAIADAESKRPANNCFQNLSEQEIDDCLSVLG